MVSQDFAKQSKEKIKGEDEGSPIALVLQADFAYLMGLVSAKEKLSVDRAKERED